MKLHDPSSADLAHSDELIQRSLDVRRRAYAPYSKYLVGAALLTSDGRIYVGCNVEAADYDGTHAEESALSAMVADGGRSPRLLVVNGGLEGCSVPTLVPPCGKCRQKLMEFSLLAGTDLRLFVADDTNRLHIVLLSELLPMSFGPANLAATR